MDTTDLYEAFTGMFTDDPVNWIKWGVVLVLLVVTYIPVIKIYGKVEYTLSWEKKADRARAAGRMVQGRLVKQRHSYKHDSQDRRRDWYHGEYAYTLDGEERIFKAMFTGGAPSTLTLYWNRPGKLFTPDEYHWENHKGCLYGLLLLLPWFIAANAGKLMGIPGLGN